MFDPLLADGLSGASERVAAFAIKCLAVGGGFLVGYFLGGAVAWALDRWVFAKKAPGQLKKAVSIVAGVGLAILVAMLVFGEGGAGFFGRGGQSEGKGTPAPEDKGKQAPPVTPPKKEDEPKPPDPKPPDPKPTPGDVRVAILSGDDVKEGRYYLLGDDPAPKTITELKDAVNALRKTAKTDIVLVLRFKKDPVLDEHESMLRLRAWVQEAKLSSRFE